LPFGGFPDGLRDEGRVDDARASRNPFKGKAGLISAMRELAV
jgi:hypothetical protein